MPLHITAYSTALFSTWIFIEELGILFDAGDGVSAGLLQKARKVKHAFISHADRDHLGGLLQFNQLNARPDFPKIYFPKDCGSFPALADFTKRFDPQVAGTQWHPLEAGDQVAINKEIFVECIRNEHVATAPHLHKSFSFKIFKIKKKLKKEYLALDGKAIQQLMQEKGRAAMTDTIREEVIAYSADTPVDDWARWDGSNILIHEATFLEKIDSKIERNQHSTLDEVLEMAANIKLNTLVLNHFSSRYSHEAIRTAVQNRLEHYQLKIPVHLILPGEITRLAL